MTKHKRTFLCLDFERNTEQTVSFFSRFLKGKLQYFFSCHTLIILGVIVPSQKE
jgi:hypothetical protein